VFTFLFGLVASEPSQDIGREYWPVFCRVGRETLLAGCNDRAWANGATKTGR